MPKRSRSPLRNWVEFLPVWLLLKTLGILPRKAAVLVGRVIARGVYALHRRLRVTAHRNLTLAMPEMDEGARGRIINQVFENLGRLLGEFSQFPKITPANIEKIVVYRGFEHYRRAEQKGRGVLLLTGHFGSWELCAFAHGAYGHPLSFLVRPLDNPLLNRMITRYRELSGNRVIDKNRSVKPVLESLKQGKQVGLLIDANTMMDQGVFCDFFGIPACSTTGLAVFALRTDAPVVPGFLIWNAELKKHCLHFEPEVELVRTGDFKEEVKINTARFTKIIEDYARRYPDQWLWVHKRWRTRPEGDPGLYDSNDLVSASHTSPNIGVEV